MPTPPPTPPGQDEYPKIDYPIEPTPAPPTETAPIGGGPVGPIAPIENPNE